jgi:hypothetical protein
MAAMSATAPKAPMPAATGTSGKGVGRIVWGLDWVRKLGAGVGLLLTLSWRRLDRFSQTWEDAREQIGDAKQEWYGVRGPLDTVGDSWPETCGVAVKTENGAPVTVGDGKLAARALGRVAGAGAKVSTMISSTGRQVTASSCNPLTANSAVSVSQTATARRSIFLKGTILLKRTRPRASRRVPSGSG